MKKLGSFVEENYASGLNQEEKDSIKMKLKIFEKSV
jgi:hypothetical protein